MTNESNDNSPRIGVVVIGRNEGERLKRCLRSLIDAVELMVYVDSGSTDGSTAFAESLGVHVIDLDMSKPFTMARGRNAGWRYLAERSEPIDFVQFVDGDCEVVEGWIEKARRTLEERSDVVAVCGWRRERFPEASIYNRLADIEWDAPTGEVRYSGGDVMMRLDAIAAVDGFNESMIAGEEPELCVRLRKRGGKILRLPEEMTRHDADMMTFSQWWKRAARGGHAYAEGAHLHGRPPEKHNVRQVRSLLLYSVVIPILLCVTIGLALLVDPKFWIAPALLLLAYPFTWWRIFRHQRLIGRERKHSALFATFCILAKFAGLQGALTYWFNRWRGRHTGLIEYKQSSSQSQPG